jgi:ABC-2 type transport system ATP-binding protein
VGVLRVPPALRQRAVDVLATQRISGMPATDAPGEVELTLPTQASPEQASTTVLTCLLEAGVPVLGFTLEGGRLSDAFLEVTKEAV